MNIRKVLAIGSIFILGILVGLLIAHRQFKEKVNNQILSESSVSSPLPLTAVNPSIIGLESTHSKTTKIIDGDTFVLESGQTVRLIGIDAPEKTDCFAHEATKEINRLILNKEVKLEKDVSEKDKYGRLLRFVFVDNLFVNDYLVREGFAKASVYPPDIKYKDQFAQAEVEAKENSRGLWGSCNQTGDSMKIQSDSKSESSTRTDLVADKDCKDFKSHAEAQAFFESQGPGDPHKLDSDGDGLACESLP